VAPLASLAWASLAPLAVVSEHSTTASICALAIASRARPISFPRALRRNQQDARPILAESADQIVRIIVDTYLAPTGDKGKFPLGRIPTTQVRNGRPFWDGVPPTWKPRFGGAFFNGPSIR
jgi:hypothetical protein